MTSKSLFFVFVAVSLIYGDPATVLTRCVDNIYQHTGTKPLRIGVIYSPENQQLIQTFKNDCSHLHIRLFPYAVPSSNITGSMKAFIINMVELNNIDLLIIPNDPIVINSQNIRSFWEGQLKSLALPVAIPPVFLHEISRKDNVFVLDNEVLEIDAQSNHNTEPTKQQTSQFQQKFKKANQSQEEVSASHSQKTRPPVSTSVVNPDPGLRATQKQTKMITPPEKSIEDPVRIAIGDHHNIKNYLKVTSKTVSVYREPAPGTQLLGMARPGDTIAVYSEDSVWLHVNFFGLHGYILKNDVNKCKRMQDLSRSPSLSFVWFTIIIFLVINVILFLLIRRNRKTSSVSTLKTCLLITGRHLRTKYSAINEKSVPIKKFIKNFGFQIKVLRNTHTLHEYLRQHSVDLIIIDFSVNHYIRSIIYQALTESSFSIEPVLLFYNVTNKSEIKQDFRFVHKAFIYNNAFTISDLNKVLLMITINENTPAQSLNPAESYLEGIFHKDTLFEIFQLIDTGKKTGCLLIETAESSGMVFFEKGIIIYAISNTMIAEEAVFKLLSQKTGSFRFISDKKPITQHLNLDVQSVLLEKARIEDETTHVALEQLIQHCVTHPTTSSDKPSLNKIEDYIQKSEIRKMYKVA